MNDNKYLDDLEIKKENYGSNFIKERKIQRFIERRKYGFDYRCFIEKQLIFAKTTEGEVIEPLISKHNILGGCVISDK